MSEDTVPESGAKGLAESGNLEEIKIDRPAEEYAKKLVEVSAENKKFRTKAQSVAQENEALRIKLQSIEEAQLKAQGEWQKMYEAEKSARSKVEDDFKRTTAAFAYKNVTTEFGSAVSKAGCQNVEDLLKLAAADGLISSLDVSEEDFKVSAESLKATVEASQKKYPYLFGKQTPALRDGLPNGKTTTNGQGKLDLSQFKTTEELIAFAKTLPR